MDFGSFQDLVVFHGHSCASLAIGFKAALLATENGYRRDINKEIIAISKNDFCAIDAIQFCLGCTTGKGNLIIRDIGKYSFTFIDMSSHKVLTLHFSFKVDDPLAFARDQRKGKRIQAILNMSGNELFSVEELNTEADLLGIISRTEEYVNCDICSELVAKQRCVRTSSGEYCLDCAGKVYREWFW